MSEAEQQRLEALHEKRRTPLSCGNRPGSNRRRWPKRKAGDRYTTPSYRRALERAVQKLNKHLAEQAKKAGEPAPEPPPQPPPSRAVRESACVARESGANPQTAAEPPPACPRHLWYASAVLRKESYEQPSAYQPRKINSHTRAGRTRP